MKKLVRIGFLAWLYQMAAFGCARCWAWTGCTAAFTAMIQDELSTMNFPDAGAVPACQKIPWARKLFCFLLISGKNLEPGPKIIR